MGSVETPIKILVIGGSYGGLSAALNLYDLCNGKEARATRYDPKGASGELIPIEIKIVDERDGYYHLIGSPLALASEDYAKKNWVRFADLPALQLPCISWAQGSVVSIDTETKAATIADNILGKEYAESYDYLVVASGLKRQWPAVPQASTRKAYLSEVATHIREVKDAKEGVIVIGGGAVGVEMAAEIKMVDPEQKVTLIHSRAKLLSSEPLPDDFKDKSREVLLEGGVKLIVNERVTENIEVESIDGSPRHRVTLTSGKQLFAGKVIFAVSKSVPTTTFMPKSTLDANGFVKIHNTMNILADSPSARAHYAAGDIISWSGIKRCGAAMATGHMAAVNIHKEILRSRFGIEPTFIEFPEIPPMIAVAIGKKAVCYHPNTGTTNGEDDLKRMFRDDLGWSICWNHMQLGVEWTKNVL
ncbi:related to pyridine nucleotide-disulphide oxidoreductase AMID-like [Rhynchosporium secalis]|uniref:Related to pyridine nucleotide-disulphide oxidoreductase AMID-like n=1 Tax=Rhynchosporium secalis TaxID=38038 RepID=A0A1E1MWF9_RHYSE|nr:related to pyridine nucleotide-disulphide oxidoreductase AMID-like [Rhynchosporium secalis]